MRMTARRSRSRREAGSIGAGPGSADPRHAPRPRRRWAAPTHEPARAPTRACVHRLGDAFGGVEDAWPRRRWPLGVDGWVQFTRRHARRSFGMGSGGCFEASEHLVVKEPPWGDDGAPETAIRPRHRPRSSLHRGNGAYERDDTPVGAGYGPKVCGRADRRPAIRPFGLPDGLRSPRNAAEPAERPVE